MMNIGLYRKNDKFLPQILAFSFDFAKNNYLCRDICCDLTIFEYTELNCVALQIMC